MLLQLVHFFLHLSDLHVSGDDLFLEESIFLS